MTYQSREKIALVVFCMLFVLVGVLLLVYIVAGHSWNVAASNIDDSFGSMDGYVTVVFDGSAEAPEQDSNTTSLSGIVEEPVTSTDVKTDYLSKGSKVISINTGQLCRYSEPIVLSAGGKRFGVFYLDENANINMCKAQVLSLAGYELDGVIALVENLDSIKHAEGVDIAIYLGDNTQTNDESATDALSASGVPTPGTNNEDADTSSGEQAGANSAIPSLAGSSAATNLSATGEYIDGIFCIPTPAKGSVGAILISPSSVVSFKTIVSL